LRAFKAIGLYAIAVVLLGALCAPWIFWTSQWLAQHVTAVNWLAEYPFRRFFNRSVMIVALAGLWPLLRILGIHSWKEVGYVRASAWWKHALIGYALGLGSLVIAAGISIALGAQSLGHDRSAGEVARAVLRYAGVGVLVALIEETFFRGALQGAFQRRMNVVAAIMLASAIYSALHFVKPNKANIPPNEVTWKSGFICLAGSSTQSFSERDVLVSSVTLFLAGCILGLAYAKTQALYLSIGLHAGWVLANEFSRWLGTGRVVEQVMAWPVLALLLVVVGWLCTTKLEHLGAPEPSLSGRAAPST
jgi:membrane protease YdiL (CAAX protease family)